MRSVLFAIVFIVFDIIEKMVIGVVHGKAVAQSIETPGGGGILGGILVAVIIAIALVPFFAFVELSRLMDAGNLCKSCLLADPGLPPALHPVNRKDRPLLDDYGNTFSARFVQR